MNASIHLQGAAAQVSTPVGPKHQVAALPPESFARSSPWSLSRSKIVSALGLTGLSGPGALLARLASQDSFHYATLFVAFVSATLNLDLKTNHK